MATSLSEILTELPSQAIEVALLDAIAEQCGAPVPHEMLRSEVTGEYTEPTPRRVITQPLDLSWMAAVLTANLAAIAEHRLRGANRG